MINNLTDRKKSKHFAKLGVVGSVIAILMFTVLEFPAPIGFESRPQGNVPYIWLYFFLLILVSEIATIPLIFKRPKSGAILGMAVGILNILQVIADQTHLMQPEVAPLSYSLLEYTVVIASLVLIYFSSRVRDKNNV